jgi:hypothetical protein
MPSVGVRTHVAAVEAPAVQATAELEGPVVVVTGASRGIGKAVALALGKAGCKVCYLSVLNTIHYVFENKFYTCRKSQFPHLCIFSLVILVPFIFERCNFTFL